MARKTKTKKQKENPKLFWMIVCLVLLVVIIFAAVKMGPVGLFLNNAGVYLCGSLYVLPILTVFFCGIYRIFFPDAGKITTRTLWGLVILNAALLLLGAYIADETANISEWTAYATQGIKSLTKDVFSFTGGLLGNLVYVLLLTTVSRTGSLIIMIMLGLVAAILLIPAEFVKGFFKACAESFGFVKTKSVQLDEKRRQHQEKAREVRQQRQQEEQERKEALLKKQKLEEEEKQAEERKRMLTEERQRIMGRSRYFINLTDEEIFGKKNPEKIFDENGSYEYYQEIHIDDDFSEKKDVKPAETQIPLVQPARYKKRKNSVYHLPRPYDQFLEAASSSSSSTNKTSAAIKGEKVIEILHNFGIEAELINTYIGPSVTKFEIKPDSSVKINRIMNISDNIKMELAAKDIRIEAPIPGRSAVGIEIPNVEPIPVKMIDLMKHFPAYRKSEPLQFALGKDLMGKEVYCDLARMPHLLIAGATGSGKSVCINTIITSFLFRTKPDEVKMVLVDPKKVEFSAYRDIPHLLWPIIDDATMASNMLKKIVVIMEERYEAFAAAGVRNIAMFNEFVEKHNENLKAEESPMEKMYYMVVIIDELADLMAIAGKEVELSIQRITQLARASGIHLIVATQRPSTDVITGLIKSNIPSRISFAVASSIDSRTVLDQTGAERLLGNGDMLYYPQGETAPIRLQGVYVTDKEINKITSFVKNEAQPEYEDSYYEFLTNMSGTTVMNANSVNADSMDSLYDEVVEFVRMQQKASTSLLQRRFGIGYNRAARLIDTLEDRGIIGPVNGAKPREVYLKPDEESEDLS